MSSAPHAIAAGRFARAALQAGPGEVCALFRRSYYLRCPGERYACIGESSLGRGPLNVLVGGIELPKLGERIAPDIAGAEAWSPPQVTIGDAPALDALRAAAAARAPAEGLACLVIGRQNALASHAQPALDALQGWLAGHALGEEAQALIGLGPGLTPSGDDYLGGMLVALRACSRASQADALWRWAEPRLAQRTSALSAAHLAAAAAGEAHEALHRCLLLLGGSADSWDDALAELDSVGHCSGWDALAGAVAVLPAP